MASFEFTAWLKSAWNCALSLGDVSGKLLTLIALPSAMVAIFTFYDEITDVLSSPDVSTQVTSLGLRCGLALDTRESIKAAQDAPQKVCNEAPLSSWVGLTLTNKDSIPRTLVNIEANLSLPATIAGTAQKVTWTNVRSVEHPIVNDVQSVWLVNWKAMRLEPFQEIPIELDFRHFELSERISFETLANAIISDPSRLVNSEFEIDICGRFSGEGSCTTLGTCRVSFNSELTESARKKSVVRAITTHSGIACSKS